MWYPSVYARSRNETHNRHHRNGKIRIQKENNMRNKWLSRFYGKQLASYGWMKSQNTPSLSPYHYLERVLGYYYYSFAFAFSIFHVKREKFALKNGLTLAFHAIGVAHGTTTWNLNRNLCALENWLTQSHCFFVGPDTVAIAIYTILPGSFACICVSSVFTALDDVKQSNELHILTHTPALAGVVDKW